MDSSNIDHRARLAAFSFLDEQTRIHGEVLPYYRKDTTDGDGDFSNRRCREWLAL